MEEQLTALEAPPRTLDVQQFAKARAAELLSLHTALNKSKKRKAPSISSSHGELHNADGHVNEHDDVDLCHTFTSLPRHLRRRTSSYARRRRPLPWLYKKKEKASSSSSVLLPFKKRKRRRKGRQAQRPIPPPPVSGPGEVPTISSQVGVDASGFMGGVVSIAASPLPLQQSNIEEEQPHLSDFCQQKLVDCRIASFIQPSTDGSLPANKDDTLCSHVSADAMDADKLATPVQVRTQELQQQPDGSIDGIGTTAPLQVNCDATQREAAYGVTSMDIEGSHGILENIIVFPSRDDKDANVSMGEGSFASPAHGSGHAAQYKVVQKEEDCNAMALENHHEVQLEAFAVSQGCRECVDSSDIDYTIPSALVNYNTAQQDGVDTTSRVDTEAMHIDGMLSPPMCNLNSEQRTSDIKTKKKVCRALRRLIDFKSGGSLVVSDGTRRLGTHLWHAKRFAMETKWGFRIPLGRPGRGRGSRAVLKWAGDQALLHDASFINAIQLHGKEEDIVEVLKLMLELPQSMDCYYQAGQTVHPWREFTRALLHHGGQAPHKIISSVVLMWKPLRQELSIQNGATEKHEDLKDQDIWLWVHAAAFEEAFQALRDVCCQLNKESNEDRVTCSSRKEDLGRLDLIGQKSFAVLEKVLFPVYRDLQGKCNAFHKLADLINPVEGNAVVHMEVSDPRLKQSERCLALDPILTQNVSFFEDRRGVSLDLSGKDCESVEEGTQPAHLMFGSSSNFEGGLEHLCSNESIDALWAHKTKPFQQKFRSPVKEKYLSKMRHLERLDSFGLIEGSVKTNRMEERRKNLSGRFRCSVILLKHEHEKATGCGWSVILPLCWISAFWVPLVFAGGHVIGIRERHWLYTDAGIPCFPEDFPDSKAYTELMAAKSLQNFIEAAPKRFPKKRLSRTSQSIPGKACCGPSGQCPLEPSDLPSTMGSPDGGNSCLIARTSKRLTSYLRLTDQTGLLLFPAQKQMKENFKGLSRRVHEGTVAWCARSQKEEAWSMARDQAACTLRVSIRPFHKGVVEVGAMVYTPTSDEYACWSCMEKVPIICTSEKQGSHHTLERAIGFVTSMAPRGSKIGAAIAFCNAVALGRARGQQWLETPWHKTGEIFLMFCNQGSSTLRPAFASIYLEKGPDI